MANREQDVHRLKGRRVMQNIHIEVVHDLVCSWCPIGYANLQRALHNLNIKAELHFLPFELNPQMGAKGEDINQHLAQRYGWSEKKQTEYRQHLLQVASNAGVEMDFSKRSHYFNTLNGHKIMHWCESQNKQQAMNERLIYAYFKEGLNIGDTEVLLKLVKELGLDSVAAKDALNSQALSRQIKAKQKRVQQLALNSVPAFVFNHNTLVSGSNSVEYFEQVLTSFNERSA